MDIVKTTKGLLQALDKGHRALATGQNVPGRQNGSVNGKANAPGQLASHIGAKSIPGVLPKGNSISAGVSNAGGNGNGGGNGNAGGGGNNGCNGNGNKPGC